ncbi:MAG: cytochrome c oxidase subunit II [Acidobacteriota bacterium]
MILALTIWAITLVTTIAFAGKYWWFPPAASAHAGRVDGQFVVTLAVTGAVFLAAQIALGFLILRYRERPGGTAHYSHGNNKLEALWTTLTTVLFFLMVLPGQGIWADLYIREAPADAIRIEVTGQQFAWNIRYPGADGRFGATRPELMNDSEGNPLGLDASDPAAEDDLVVPVMAVPINRPIELLLRSKDVTHAFFVRELRVKQDTVPGLVVPLRFTATRIGRYEVACAELCGLGHHRMRTFVSVLSEADYAKWLADMSED